MILKHKTSHAILIVLLLIGLLSIGWLDFLQASDTRSFEEANAKYQAGDFEKAASLYEAALQSDQCSAAVYFNLGNTFFRLHNLGKALVAYERALSAAPRDRDLLWNTAILRSVLHDRIEESSGNQSLTWLKHVAKPFTMDEIAISLTAFLILFLVVAFFNFILPSSKKYSQGVLLLIFLAILGAILFLIVRWMDVKDPWVVVLDKEVSARYGPSETETNAFVIHEGAKVKVLDESKGWVYIYLNNKESGWIPKKSCEFV